MTQVIRYLKDGKKEIVDNNTAFTLIENGVAVLDKNYKYPNKMLTTKNKKYKVK